MSPPAHCSPRTGGHRDSLRRQSGWPLCVAAAPGAAPLTPDAPPPLPPLSRHCWPRPGHCGASAVSGVHVLSGGRGRGARVVPPASRPNRASRAAHHVRPGSRGESHARALGSRVALWQQGPGSSSLSASVPARALPALVRTPVATLAREGSVAPHSLVGRERGLKLSRDLDVTAPTPPHTPFLSSPQVTGSR